MKIDSLELNQFRNHKATEIDLAGVNVFTGSNAGGKTSIKVALEYLLTGRCRAFTDGRGAGASDLIRHGQKTASVGATVWGKKLTRTIPGGLEVEGLQGSSTIQEKLVYDRLGVSVDVMSALLNTSAFIDMPGKEQKDMLFSLLGVELTREKLHELITETGVDADTAQWCVDKVFHNGLKPDAKLGPEAIDTLFELAYSSRRDTNRTVKNLEAAAKVEPAETEIPDGFTAETFEKAMENPEGVKRTLAQLEADRAALLRLAGKAESDAENKAKSKVELEAEMNRLIDENKPRLSGYKKEPTDKDIAKLKKQLTVKEDTLESIEAAREEANDRAKEIETKVKTLSEASERIKDSGDCPAAPGLIKCTMKKSERDKIIAKFEDDIASLEAERISITQQTGSWQDKASELTADAELVKGEIKRIETILETSQTIRDLAFKIGQTKDEPADTTQADLAELDERIKKGRALSEAVAIELAKESGGEDKLETARAEAAKWDQLVEVFGPDGIKAGLLTGVIGPVEASINERLSALTGGKYSASITATPDFSIDITTPSGTVPLRLLSGSERLRVGIIIQDALARLTDVKLLVIDEMDLLRGPAKMEFFSFIDAIAGDYDTILVFASVDEKPIAVPDGDVRFFWVDGGSVEALSRVAEAVA